MEKPVPDTAAGCALLFLLFRLGMLFLHFVLVRARRMIFHIPATIMAMSRMWVEHGENRSGCGRSPKRSVSVTGLSRREWQFGKRVFLPCPFKLCSPCLVCTLFYWRSGIERRRKRYLPISHPTAPTIRVIAFHRNDTQRQCLLGFFFSYCFTSVLVKN